MLKADPYEGRLFCFRVFGGFLIFRFAACGSPTAADANERKASCSPPQWGGGELRDSQSRKIHMRQPIPRQEHFR